MPSWKAMETHGQKDMKGSEKSTLVTSRTMAMQRLMASRVMMRKMM